MAAGGTFHLFYHTQDNLGFSRTLCSYRREAVITPLKGEERWERQPLSGPASA